jgi:hypothetical protein
VRDVKAIVVLESTLMCAVPAFAGHSANASGGDDYLFNGRALTRVSRGRPEAVSAKEWQIWLFRNGATASGTHYCLT